MKVLETKHFLWHEMNKNGLSHRQIGELVNERRETVRKYVVEVERQFLRLKRQLNLEQNEE